MLEEILRGLFVIAIASGITLLVIGYIVVISKLAEMNHRKLALLIGGLGTTIVILVFAYIIGSSISW